MAKLSLSALIRKLHPEVTKLDFAERVIFLKDNSDSLGAFIAEWNYAEPMHPDLQDYYKPTA